MYSKWKPALFTGMTVTCLGIVFIIISVIAVILNESNGWPFFIMLVGTIMALIGIPIIITGRIKRKRYYDEQSMKKVLAAKMQREKNSMEEWISIVYPSLLFKLNVPTDAKVVKTYTGNIPMDQARLYDQGIHYIWVADSNLKLLPRLSERYIPSMPTEVLNSTFVHISIPLNEIEYYYISGERYRETKISGGDGGGISIGGALVGSFIAGDVGAIIGSRKASTPLSSEMVMHDSRETVLCFFQNGTRKTMRFRYEDIQVFDDLIPEKNHIIVTEVKRQTLIQSSIKAGEPIAITAQIRELAGLRDDGIITEGEFQTKKNELLTKM